MEKEGGEKIRKQESKMWMEIKENCFLSNVKEFIQKDKRKTEMNSWI